MEGTQRNKKFKVIWMFLRQLSRSRESVQSHASLFVKIVPRKTALRVIVVKLYTSTFYEAV